MSVLQLPTEIGVKVMGTSELVKCGSFTSPRSVELGSIQLLVLKTGFVTYDGTERLRIKVFTDDGYSKLYATSEWFLLSQIPAGESPEGVEWIGRVTFEFAKQHIHKNQTYYAAVESEGYERDGDSFYVGFLLDWPEPRNVIASAPRYPLHMSLYGYERR